jgi:hypothetical protein
MDFYCIFLEKQVLSKDNIVRLLLRESKSSQSDQLPELLTSFRIVLLISLAQTASSYSDYIPADNSFRLK